VKTTHLSNNRYLEYLCIWESRSGMRVLQLFLTFGRAAFTKEVVKPFGFFNSHVYASRMEPEKSIIVLKTIFTHPDIQKIMARVAKQIIFKCTNPHWERCRRSKILYSSCFI